MTKAHGIKVGDNNGDLIIGHYIISPVHWANGTIDEVAIFNRTLSAEEILEHYVAGLSGDGYCSPGISTPTLEERVAALEEKLEMLNTTDQEQDTKIEMLNTTVQQQETKIGLIDSTVNTLKDFVNRIYDALSKKQRKDIGPWPF